MYWSGTTSTSGGGGAVREELPMSTVNRVVGTPAETTQSVNPGAGAQVTTACCTPPPSYHNINLPVGHPSVLVHESGAPPSYEEAIDPNASPPSYDSLFGRMREARKVSKDIFDFFKNILYLLLGTIGFTILLGMTILIPLCMMVIGGLYLYDCPQGEYIPIYLLVGGGFGIFKQYLYLSGKVRKYQEGRDQERIKQSPTETLITCFMLGWFIIGSMWVYKEYEPNYDPALGKYCNKTLYLFAFWLITSVYICLGIITACMCSITIASIVCQ
ncbi:hypothetical protein DMN91_009255 [Ooceraea biroi]|uniref:Transmembrane protein n=1 Tax=Ooceraea biroi TaxID=2015173 RepID=A0A026WRN5_OOCBI|nr:uncharacterized protein LOC105276153 [Ooceraea biroi]EZA58705.1 hypothetical protein X777_14874 [Ooceraea biroi]RLU18897.1 hypothetical protein DMN91_009255 [Ooceraea biroi]